MTEKNWKILNEKYNERQIRADSIDVTENGDLLFKTSSKNITVAIAAGRWVAVQEVVPG